MSNVDGIRQCSPLTYSMLTSNPDFSTLEELNRDIGASPLYARTKLAQVLLMRFMHQLKSLQPDNKLGLKAGQAPWINATHPGAVVTDQQDQAVEAYGTMGKLGVKAARTAMKDSIDEGCRSALFAATSKEVSSAPIDGEYIVPDCKVTDVSKEAKDEQLAERLWRLVETILKEKLGSLDFPLVLVR